MSDVLVNDLKNTVGQKQSDKSPLVRFDGFTDDWEQRKLGDEADVLAGGDVDKSKLLVQGKYPVFANALTNDGIVGYYEDCYRIESPAVTVTGRGDVGYAKARKVNFTPVVRLLSVKSTHDVDFLEHAINSHKVLIESTGVPQLTSPQLSNYKIWFTSTSEERKIGSFFKQLDDTIGLHQRKLDILSKTKQTFLQKIFPKKGSSVPEVRLDVFTDDWEEKTLSEICNIVKGSQKNKSLLSTIMTPDFCYPVYNGGIDVSGYTDEYNRESSISISEGGASAGYVNQVAGKFWSGGHNYTLDIYDAYNADFLKSYLDSQQSQLLRLKVGTGLPNVQKSALSSFSVLAPLVEEQQKIGQFFKKLDDRIEAEQTKIKQLKEMKNALLQRMFV